jgi:hypothetical protein
MKGMRKKTPSSRLKLLFNIFQTSRLNSFKRTKLRTSFSFLPALRANGF